MIKINDRLVKVIFEKKGKKVVGRTLTPLTITIQYNDNTTHKFIPNVYLSRYCDYTAKNIPLNTVFIAQILKDDILNYNKSRNSFTGSINVDILTKDQEEDVRKKLVDLMKIKSWHLFPALSKISGIKLILTISEWLYLIFHLNLHEFNNVINGAERLFDNTKLQKGLDDIGFSLKNAKQCFERTSYSWVIDTDIFYNQLVNSLDSDWKLFQRVTNSVEVNMGLIKNKLDKLEFSIWLFNQSFRRIGYFLESTEDNIPIILKTFSDNPTKNFEAMSNLEDFCISSGLTLEVTPLVWLGRVYNYSAANISDFVSSVTNHTDCVKEIIENDLFPRSNKYHYFETFVAMICSLDIKDIIELLSNCDPATDWYKRVFQEVARINYHTLKEKYLLENDVLEQYLLSKIFFKYEEYFGEILPAEIQELRHVHMEETTGSDSIFQEERLKFWLTFDPNKIYKVKWDNREYHILIIDKFAIVESPVVGNACYITDCNNWKEVVKTSKGQLIKEGKKGFYGRIIHDPKGDWQEHPFIYKILNSIT